jgi:DNA-binding NarL/FixJ family response regulator
MIRVLLADDHGLVRAGLERLLSGAEDIEVVGTAAGGREAVDRAGEMSPDVVLMDLSMPDLDGIAATRGVLERCPDCQVVVLTSFSDRDRIVAALDAGAIGYLLKDTEPEELLRGVRAAARGESPLDPKAARQLIAGRRTPAPQDQLTERERQILALIAAGTPNKVIARRLDIAEKTVKNHVTRIFETIGVTDRTQAALWAQKHFSPEDAGSS